MNTTTLTPKARRTDPATSHAAALSVNRTRLPHVQRTIVSLLTLNGPQTDEELAYLWGEFVSAPISSSGLRTRRAELVERGLVRDSGERRKIASGRTAIVWEVVR